MLYSILSHTINIIVLTFLLLLSILYFAPLPIMYFGCSDPLMPRERGSGEITASSIHVEVENYYDGVFAKSTFRSVYEKGV